MENRRGEEIGYIKCPECLDLPNTDSGKAKLTFPLHFSLSGQLSHQHVLDSDLREEMSSYIRSNQFKNDVNIPIWMREELPKAELMSNVYRKVSLTRYRNKIGHVLHCKYIFERRPTNKPFIEDFDEPITWPWEWTEDIFTYSANFDLYDSQDIYSCKECSEPRLTMDHLGTFSFDFSYHELLKKNTQYATDCKIQKRNLIRLLKSELFYNNAILPIEIRRIARNAIDFDDVIVSVQEENFVYDIVKHVDSFLNRYCEYSAIPGKLIHYTCTVNVSKLNIIDQWDWFFNKQFDAMRWRLTMFYENPIDRLYDEFIDDIDDTPEDDYHVLDVVDPAANEVFYV